MATGMESAAATSFSNIVIAPLVKVLQDRYKMLKNLKEESEKMQTRLLMLAAAMDDQSTTENRTAVAGAYSEVMRDLTHDMEDCIERFLHRVTCKEGASLARRAIHGLSTLRRCSRFASSIKKLRKRLDEARNGIISPPGGGHETPPGPGSDPVDPNPVGIAEATKELLTLLDEVEGEPGQLRVISIVGFGGSGKTTLANAVYQEAFGFRCRAWVDRSKGKNTRDLLKTIIQQVCPREDVGESDEEHLRDYLKNYLRNRRYLIVIDDIEMKQWNTIKSIMENDGTSSRIIVTTTIQSMANQCSFGNGYVYKMRTLGELDSRNIVFPGEHSPELVQSSTTLLKKCDGLPLALVSVANHLRSENELTGQRCADLCRDLGIYLQDERSFARHANITLDNFVRLRGMLMDYYTSLPDYVVRTCLLYLGIFPHDWPLKRNVIIRRWLAEGYARNQYLGSDLDVAVGNFQKFIDLSIIQPVDTSNNAVVKICKTHGIMHEFVLHKSMSEKLVRHFSVHMHDTNCRTILDLSRVRSLTVFGNAGDAISNFHKYKLIRVLDLEECSDVHDRHLKDICKLWNLRYLSLGANITMLPKEISKLKLLETLDARKTKVTVLPLEVIGLPCLTHLIGKFKLPDQVGAVNSKLKQLSKKSNLQSLAGFVADESQGFAQLMVHMKKLKKVKIWCEFTGDGGSLTDHLSHAIQEYIKAPNNMETDVRSLSINFERCSEQILQSCYEENKFLHSLKDPCYLSSLKLHGDLSRLHQYVALPKGLRELCLSSTTTLTPDLLSDVSKLPFLLYFKLIANHIDNFTIEVGTFKSLRRLRFIMQSLRRLEIRAEALTELVSLQLFCKDLAALSSDEIKHLIRLKEVALDSRVTTETRGEWRDAARSHPNRPNVLFIEPVGNPVAPEESAPETSTDPTGNEPVGNPVALEESAPETSTDPTGNQPVGNPVAPEESAPETSTDPTGNEPVGNAVAPEESAPETSTDPTGNEPVGNPVAPEELAPETTIQGRLLGEGSIPFGQQRGWDNGPAQSSLNDELDTTSNNLGFSDTTDDLTGAAQSDPNDALNSTSNGLGFRGRSDNSTNSKLTEFSVALEESTPETGIQGQLVGEGSEPSGLRMGPKNGATQSSLHNVPNSTSNNLVSPDGNDKSTGISVAPEESTIVTGFPGQQDEEGSDMQTEEENSTFVTSGVKGCPNAGNRTVPFHQNDDNPGP